MSEIKQGTFVTVAYSTDRLLGYSAVFEGQMLVPSLLVNETPVHPSAALADGDEVSIRFTLPAGFTGVPQDNP